MRKYLKNLKFDRVLAAILDFLEDMKIIEIRYYKEGEC
jgi:hypothetical protein